MLIPSGNSAEGRESCASRLEKVSAVMCDRRLSAGVKGEVNSTVVRAVVRSGLKTEAVRNR